MLSPDRWQIVERVFHEALAVPAPERQAFVDSSCASDPELRSEVETLLAAASGSDSAGSIASYMATAWAGDHAPTLVGREVDSYRVLALLGAGGMGEVYLAEDDSLGRRVALKLLPARFSADPGRLRRFTEEARAASALNHPNIITVYHIGVFEGRRFIATEFIDGETLRDRLARGPLPDAEALDVTLQVAAALGAAHDAGIIHRDIKPENVMIRRDGYVKVLDFGLAKLAPGETLEDTGALEATPVRITAAGAVLGTLHYMAPEQAAGGLVDARADLYSLGVVLHEMLTGTVANAGSGERRGAGTEAPRLRSHLSRIVARALATDPVARYQTAADFRRDLETVQRALAAAPARRRGWRVGTAIGGLVALAIVAATFLARPRVEAPPAVTLAVLPFQAPDVEESEKYLGLGLADAVITQLGRMPQLNIRPTEAVRQFATADVDPVSAGQKLKVDHVLTGFLQRDRDRIRLTVQLVDVTTGRTRWSSRFDNQFTDLFAVQDAVSQNLALALVDRLTANDKARLALHHPASDEAYREYLQARVFLNQVSRDSSERSVTHFMRAIAIDSNYALAYAGLARAYQRLGIGAIRGMSPHEAMPLARQWAEKALMLDDGQSEAHAVLGLVMFQYEWDWSGAEVSFRRALALSPTNAGAHQPYGWFLGARGRFDEGIRELRRARELDPVSILTAENLGVVLWLAGHSDDALRVLQEASAIDPNFGRPYSRQIAVYEELRRFDAAFAAWHKSLVVSNRPAEAEELARSYAEGGYQGAAAFAARYGVTHHDPFQAALGYLFLGDRDHALEQLEICYQERYTWLPFLSVDSRFNALRSDPRFQDLLRRLNLS